MLKVRELLRTATLVSLMILCTSFYVGGNSSKDGWTQVRNTNSNKGWLRVCNHNLKEQTPETSKHYEVEAEACPHGAWLSESLQGGCVCLNGLWAISQKWCDEDYFIVYGKGNCFKLDKPIQKLAFLGNAQDAFKPTNFVTKENGHVFRSFNNEFIMPYEFSRDTNRTLLRLRPSKGTGVLFEIRPDTTWEEEYIKMRVSLTDTVFDEEPICVKPDFKNEGMDEDALMIYKVKTGIKYIKVTKQCPKPMFQDYGFRNNEDEVSAFKVLPGQAIHVKSGRIINAADSCDSACSKISNALSANALERNTESALIRHKRQALDILELDRDFTGDERDEIVRTANLRVVKQELNWLLEEIRPPSLKTENWKLMRKVKEIFVKACPDAVTPTFLVNAMMRLFRLFFLNSRDFYPNGHMLEERAQNERMSNTLDLCLNDASEFQFNFDLIKDDKYTCRDFKDEDNNVTIKYCTCKELLGYVNISYSLNLTGPASSHLVYGKNLEVANDLIFLIPEENQFDADVHDFPTETMWKVVMFTHFYCAKYFQHNPGDFSALMNKMEDFFNEDMIYRWTKPGNSTFEIWKKLYSRFELKKFAKSVDACVAVAKFVSAYPEWLNRPTLDIKRRRKRSLDNAKLWKGSAYCLEDPWDPVYKLGVEVQDKCIDLNRY